MRALVLTGPGAAVVREVPEPVAGPGEVVVDVERAGICGTDVELFTGDLSYLQSGITTYPVRPGHEWCGVVTDIGPDVDAGLLGRLVTGDTMVGCGRCARCRSGRHHVCADRDEVGIRGAIPGALAERLAVPARTLHQLPDDLDVAAGALVEPGGNALRCVQAAELPAGGRLLVLGTGTIGLLTALFARAAKAEVHLLGRDPAQLALARELGFDGAWTHPRRPDLPWDAVVDATNDPTAPALALDLVEPGRRIVYIGLSGVPSTVDTRELALKDVTAVGVLGASAGLPGAIAAYAWHSVDPRPLVGATIGLDEVPAALAGHRPATAGPGPKLLVDPRR
ncbi:zinc-dependent alcohol dehydrogenase [Dactylosporangium matsuzakiense]|uniref:Alcohol dehydrogenase n=1 Tax=Dactylosporangium matsuzakiense TaxID=53360 RepID=A0A9W6NKX0_9ACTN|nr:alcohol dehydrogenase catalytic domain-containing protein [Dactylosporangium matsuzakiense]UWZ42558.1 alcohol dehydrogenase catalytic domain-containing protein [Dactylosporangium matsuzakiense]GLL00523.1 alcohol dehydrogenase [Dactylosporangium matsuzakiense]